MAFVKKYLLPVLLILGVVAVANRIGFIRDLVNPAK